MTTFTEARALDSQGAAQPMTSLDRLSYRCGGDGMEQSLPRDGRGVPMPPLPTRYCDDFGKYSAASVPGRQVGMGRRLRASISSLRRWRRMLGYRADLAKMSYLDLKDLGFPLTPPDHPLAGERRTMLVLVLLLLLLPAAIFIGGQFIDTASQSWAQHQPVLEAK